MRCPCLGVFPPTVLVYRSPWLSRRRPSVSRTDVYFIRRVVADRIPDDVSRCITSLVAFCYSLDWTELDQFISLCVLMAAEVFKIVGPRRFECRIRVSCKDCTACELSGQSIVMTEIYKRIAMQCIAFYSIGQSRTEMIPCCFGCVIFRRYAVF